MTDSFDYMFSQQAFKIKREMKCSGHWTFYSWRLYIKPDPNRWNAQTLREMSLVDDGATVQSGIIYLWCMYDENVETHFFLPKTASK